MHKLPENPTAYDIIKRSIVAHPSLFVDSLRGRQEEDAYAASVRRDGRVRSAALTSARAHERAREFVERADLGEGERAALIIAETGPAIVALNMACELQCLPAHVRSAAAVMLDEAQ